MIVTINGKVQEIKALTSLVELIDSRNLCSQNLVIEHNAVIVPRQDWEKITLKEKDTVEIVSFVGGG